mmetsp:Transcript_29138/g.46183  ORF Transcript_29138/g.46183 Transcript_29138/m.46183 type:complete len:264 (-) Transcript_29138:338-1129(-)
MIPGTGPANIDAACNAWDWIRWIFVLWTFFTPMICLILNLIYGVSVYWVVVTFLSGIVFLAVSHCILSRDGKYKSTYEMVEEEIEFGEREHQQAQKGYTVCDGCAVELSASDDIFEKNCKERHIICSHCYNLWFNGFTKLNFNVTQDWRRHIQHIACPICDHVIDEHGELDLNRLSQQIQSLQLTKSNALPSTAETASEAEDEAGDTQMVVRTIDLPAPSQKDSRGHITQSNDTNSGQHSTTDESNSNFEMISTADFLGATAQ